MKLIINENISTVEESFNQNKNMIENNKKILEVRNCLQILLLQRTAFEKLLNTNLVRIEELKNTNRDIFIEHANAVLIAQKSSIESIILSTNIRIEELNNLSVEMVTNNGESK